MAANTTPIFPGRILQVNYIITDNSDTSTVHSLFSDSENGSRIDSIICYNYDANNIITIGVFVNDGSTSVMLNKIDLQPDSSTDLVKEMKLDQTDGSLFIASGQTLEVKLLSAGDGTSHIDICVMGGSY